MRRLSSKGKKGKSAASDNGKESAPEAETQSNENQAPSDDEESLSEKRSSLNPGKKNKRGRKSTNAKSEDAGLEESGDEESSSEKKVSSQATKNKRGKRSTATKVEYTDNGEEEDDLPLSSKVGKEKKGQKNSTRENEEEESEGENYEVEKVVGFRMHSGTKQYRIRWKGYGKEQDTWESEADLSCPDFIEAFLAENPDAVKKSTEVAGKSGVKTKQKKSTNSVQPKAKKQRMADPVAEEDGQKVYEVDKVVEVHFKKNGEREFLIRWKGFSSEDDTWEPESNLNCKELIERFMEKVKKAKEATVRELRVNPQITNRFTLHSPDSGRRISSRNTKRQRTTYFNTE